MKIPMTRKGHEQIREELDRLRKIERPKVIQAISEARAHGDISENAEFLAAKERQSFIEGRIKELETQLVDAEVIDTSQLPSDKVVFGTTVTLLDIETKQKKQYTLVGQGEADLKNGQISVQSPVGRALIGHKAGDKVTVSTPAKTIQYQILEITVE